MSIQRPDFRLQVPAGDDRDRKVCATCGFVDYVNPRIVVGSVVVTGEGTEERLLLCRRAIDPRKGFWTVPAGFMETGETTEAGAKREAREEAHCELDVEGLLAVYDLPHLSQVQMMFRTRLIGSAFAAGPESLEVALFRWEEIPWSELAFPSVVWALNQWRAGRARPIGALSRNPAPDDPAAKPPTGSGPPDTHE